MTILYKYVPFNIGLDIINNNSILFSKPETFNDPFDMPFYPNELGEDGAPSIFSRFRNLIKNDAWATKTGILSLTRTPFNALMWAHYANGHHGMVIGIDMDIAGFTNEQCCLIPAQYGSVVYVSRRITNPFSSSPASGLTIGATHHFPKDHYEKLQRLFLHKPNVWSYEEEVRVIKSLDGLDGETDTSASGTFSFKEVDGRRLHLYRLPEGAIREIYFGIRAENTDAEAIASQITADDPSVAIFESVLDNNLMSVRAEPYEVIRL